MAQHAHIRCPSCQGALVSTQLRCNACELTVSGRFPANEFASLDEDDLHLLRIFVLAEGHIREMESALGVSYPTIKGRMARLKERLLEAQRAKDESRKMKVEGVGAAAGGESEILRDLEAGRLSYEQALARLHQLRAKE